MIASTDTSMSSPIMMLWFDFLVSTNIRNCLPACLEYTKPTTLFQGERSAREASISRRIGIPQAG
jgi:hypothetical protein